MTIPTYTGMQTALTGLQAYMAAIDTTGENITNANTLGYTRQTVDLGETDPLQIDTASSATGEGAQLGTGVSIDDITRVRDTYLDGQYRAQSGQESNASTLSTTLTDAEDALGETGTSGSISAALSGVFSAFNSLASVGSGSSATGAQAAVVGSVQTLQSELAGVQQQLSTLQTQSGQQLAALTATGGQVLTDAKQIASLNTQIESATAAGQSPNTLLDQRDSLLDDLSSLATTTVTPNANGNGGVSVSFAGQTLVSSADTVSFDATQISASSGGTLGALASLSDTSSAGALEPFVSGLDTIAGDLVGEVNAAAGATVMSGTSVATLSIDSTAVAGLTGAQATAVAARANGTAYGADGGYVDDLGTAAQGASSTATTAQSLLTAISNQRQSVSGVSLDEEMSNLIQFQQGYQASARMMNTMNSVIETLISTVGGGGV